MGPSETDIRISRRVASIQVRREEFRRYLTIIADFVGVSEEAVLRCSYFAREVRILDDWTESNLFLMELYTERGISGGDFVDIETKF